MKDCLRRPLSLLMSLLLAVALLPVVPSVAHADYEDGAECALCGHYHWGDWMCECGLCSEDCENDSCWYESHCKECGACLLTASDHCLECGRCGDCMQQDHCQDCGACNVGDSDILCGTCERCANCVGDICDTCGNCESCALDSADPLHCSICGECYGNVGYCDAEGSEGTHCVDCHEVCEQCGRCDIADELTICDDCGLCAECCDENSYNEGCDDGSVCVESSEWSEHFCENCSTCFHSAEQCEECGLCLDCCADQSECSDGMCVESADYENHFCQDCGACFHDTSQCGSCESEGELRCEDCCADIASQLGCDCGTWCSSDPNFEDHLNAEHGGVAAHTHKAGAGWISDDASHWHACRYCDEVMDKANHNYNANNICTVCGYKSGSQLYITYQPRDVRCITSVYEYAYDEEPENGFFYQRNNPVTFKVTAKSGRGALTYQWYRLNIAKGTATALEDDEDCQGATTAELTIYVTAEACQLNGEYSYFCKISNDEGSVQTREARIIASHAYSGKQGQNVEDDTVSARTYSYLDASGAVQTVVAKASKGHMIPCLFEYGTYDEHYKSKTPAGHTYGPRVTLGDSAKPGAIGQVFSQTCTTCGYVNYTESHVHDYYGVLGDGVPNISLSDTERTFAVTIDGVVQHLTTIEFLQAIDAGKCTQVGPDGEEIVIKGMHPLYCSEPGCDSYKLVPHRWGGWTVAAYPHYDSATGASSPGGMARECLDCGKSENKFLDAEGNVIHWTDQNALVLTVNASANKPLLEANGTLALTPQLPEGHKLTGWKVEYVVYSYSSSTGWLPAFNGEVTEKCSFAESSAKPGQWNLSIPTFQQLTGGYSGGGILTVTALSSPCVDHSKTKLVGQIDQVCTHDGYTGDTVCEQCGTVVSLGSIVPASADAEHEGELVAMFDSEGNRLNAHAADCKHRAYEGDLQCSVCGDRVTGPRGDFAHGVSVLTGYVAPTCTTEGYTGDKVCKECNVVLERGKALPMHSATLEAKDACEPTCTATGFSGDQCCAECGALVSSGHLLGARGHLWDEGVVTLEPTTTTPGVRTYTCTREGCGATKTENIPVHVCSFDREVADAKYLKNPATCTTAAEYFKSCACGEVGTETFFFGTALDHEEDLEKWCGDASDHWRVCKRCQVEIPGTRANHMPDRDAPTELFPVKCTTCGATLAKFVGLDDGDLPGSTDPGKDSSSADASKSALARTGDSQSGLLAFSLCAAAGAGVALFACAARRVRLRCKK